MRGPVLAIVGPTATGKSHLSELVATKLGCSVISCDSMQVYRGMDIGTAKTPLNERKVTLDMVDVVDVSCNYSAQMFQEQARTYVECSLDASGYALLCGGTGLYLDAVIDDMHFPKGEKLSATRKAYEETLALNGPQELWKLLSERDEASARLIHPNNSKRVIRALEMLDEGSSYANSSSGLHEHKPFYRSHIWALTMDRAQLYERINARVDEMFAAGLIEEVKALRTQGLSEDVTAGQAIGYKEVLRFLNGEITRESCIEEVKASSRKYAKRQLSWFRRDNRVLWIDLDTTSYEKACNQILAIAQGKHNV